MEGKRLQQFTTPRCPVLSSNEVTQIRQNSENDVQGNYGAKNKDSAERSRAGVKIR